MRRKKQGIRVTKSKRQDVSRAAGPDGDDTMEVMFSSQSKKIKKRRAELAYSTGPKRKFLTEPPENYRAPADTAVAGDLGLDKKVIDEQEKKDEEYRKDAVR